MSRLGSNCLEQVTPSTVLRECVILAGGQGTRLRKAVSDVPKPLAPVAGSPFLDILCYWLASQGLQRIVLSLGYGGEAIAEHVGNNFMGMETDCVIETIPLGTGGGLRLALDQCHEEVVLVCNGDTFLDYNLHKLSMFWIKQRRPLILAAYVEDTSRYGRLSFEGENVIGLVEKSEGGSGYINAGVYVLPRHSLDNFQIGSAFSLERDFLVPALQQKLFGFYRTKGFFIDIGVPDDYVVAQKCLAFIANMIESVTIENKPSVVKR